MSDFAQLQTGDVTVGCLTVRRCRDEITGETLGWLVFHGGGLFDDSIYDTRGEAIEAVRAIDDRLTCEALRGQVIRAVARCNEREVLAEIVSMLAASKEVERMEAGYARINGGGDA